MQNFIGMLMVRLLGNRLDGKKSIIGGVCLILSALVAVAGHIWPDLNLPGGNESWEVIFGGFGAGLGALGVTHKAYKIGLDTPVPDVPIGNESAQPGIVRDPMGK